MIDHLAEQHARQMRRDPPFGIVIAVILGAWIGIVGSVWTVADTLQRAAMSAPIQIGGQ
jgi:hypothetical protein